MTISLRSLKEKDAKGMLEWMTDPSIVCFFRFDASKIVLDNCLDFISDSAKDTKHKHFAIVDERDEYLGTISLKEINSDEKTAEYAISTRRCVHGTGVAIKATYAVFDIAFHQYSLEKIYLNVLSENIRANKFYQKIGFHYESCERQAIQIRGEWKNLNWYTYSKQDYQRLLENGKQTTC